MTNGSNSLHFYYDAQNRPAVVEFNWVPYAYVHNLQGDIIAIVDSAGTKVVEYKYDAWGKPIAKTGSLANTLGTLNPFRYRGYVYDEETGLYYLNSRYYSPFWCRFANADMQINCLGDIAGKNIYCYCNNMPIISIDRDGRKPGDIFSTPDEAAIDFAKCYNGLSISQNCEYASIIYKRTEESFLIDFWSIKLIPTHKREYYTYSEPSVGTEDTTADVVVPVDLNCRLIAWIHSHGAYRPNYDSRMFSRDDYAVANQLLKDEGIMYSYLSTPNGSLWRYDAVTGQLKHISADIPFDPNDPNRILPEAK